MTKAEEQGQFDSLKNIIIEAIKDKKGEEIISIDLKDVNHPFTEMFIICHANSTTQAETIANNVIEKAKKEAGERPSVVEGLQNREWILLDYFDIIVHIFTDDKRRFYALEELWSDGQLETYS